MCVCVCVYTYVYYIFITNLPNDCFSYNSVETVSSLHCYVLLIIMIIYM